MGRSSGSGCASSGNQSKSLRSSEYPLVCGPLDPMPNSTSPGAMVDNGNRRSRSTTPTSVPATSKAPGMYTPGISAVSPPSSTQPDAAQAMDMPLTTAATCSARMTDDAK
ncbi:unannotated protein [freshwater metagenome]|uniref:Unannotated protein n=1 Tax=freshwater metagenome TaxID=449393 RepID=A0A6J6YET6_9ZZZZ